MGGSGNLTGERSERSVIQCRNAYATVVAFIYLLGFVALFTSQAISRRYLLVTRSQLTFFAVLPQMNFMARARDMVPASSHYVVTGPNCRCTFLVMPGAKITKKEHERMRPALARGVDVLTTLILGGGGVRGLAQDSWRILSTQHSMYLNGGILSVECES